jgi:hypothetical protein
MTGLEIPILTRNAYTYYMRHCHGRGWQLFDLASGWPNIQGIDEVYAFQDDALAAQHVVRAAAFDAGREGHACREALRTIIRFGEQGLNPIATMLSRGGHR